MGNWLSDWIDTRSGANLKIDADAQQGRFNTAMQPVTEGMAEMKGIVKQQMDPNSKLNQNALATSKEQSADDIAEANRLASRNVAMGGGNATAASFLGQDAINNMTGKVYSDFQNNMNNRTEAGLESLSGIYSNLGSIAQAGFNMNESALASNKMIDRNATIAKGNMLGGALKIGGGLLSGNPMMALSGAGSMLQKGGMIENPYYKADGGYVDHDNPKPVGNGMSDEDSMLQLAVNGMQKGGMSRYNPAPGDNMEKKYHLEEGEFVLNRNAVADIGKEKLEHINEEVSPRFPKQNPDDDRSIKMRMGGYLYG